MQQSTQQQHMPALIALDLESVLVPEFWPAIARALGLPELEKTTREVIDYVELMNHRVFVCRNNNVKLPEVQRIIGQLNPLDGAIEFLDTLRRRWPVVILSDTLWELAQPILPKIEWPCLLCHTLEFDSDGMFVRPLFRQPDPKRAAVIGFQNLGYQVVAVGDSNNDITMLKQANKGFLFRPRKSLASDFRQIEPVDSYDLLLAKLEARSTLT